jgi:hypothetical protein
VSFFVLEECLSTLLVSPAVRELPAIVFDFNQ